MRSIESCIFCSHGFGRPGSFLHLDRLPDVTHRTIALSRNLAVCSQRALLQQSGAIVNEKAALSWFQAIQTQIAGLPEGSDRAKAWSDCVIALHFRMVYFAYHRDEFGRHILDGLAHIEENEHDKAMIEAAFGEHDAEHVSVNAVLAAAHLVAAAQSLHAACELSYRMAYWALGLNATALSLSLSNFAIQDVAKSSYGRSKTELQQLMESTEYDYLAGFVGVSKFRHLLSPRPQLCSEEGDERGDLQIAGFEHGRGKKIHSYPSKWANDFLMSDCESLVNRLHSVGVAIAHDMV